MKIDDSGNQKCHFFCFFYKANKRRWVNLEKIYVTWEIGTFYHHLIIFQNYLNKNKN